MLEFEALLLTETIGRGRDLLVERTYTAEVLSFEPVYLDGCTPAPTLSKARTMRAVPEGRHPGRHQGGCELGNSLCYAAKHVVLRWKSFGGKWQSLATRLAGLPVGGHSTC